MMEITPDYTYPKDIQYCRIQGVCIALCDWKALENDKEWNCTILGKHIKQSLSNHGEYTNAVYFYNQGGDSVSKIIKLAQYLHNYAKDWVVEEVIPFRQCILCNEICKIDIPMDELVYMPNIHDHCMICLKFLCLD